MSAFLFSVILSFNGYHLPDADVPNGFEKLMIFQKSWNDGGADDHVTEEFGFLLPRPIKKSYIYMFKNSKTLSEIHDYFFTAYYKSTFPPEERETLLILELPKLP
jgi:hypothetical protein